MNILTAYIFIGLCLAYILNHQLKVVRLIPTKTDVKMRNKINKKQEQLELYIKLCPIWPFLLLKEVYDEIWCVLPCNPLLKVSDLIQASKIFNKTKADHLISITKFPVPIEWAFEVNKKDKIKILNPKKTKVPSNKLKKKFFDAGMFYIYRTDKIFSNPKNYKMFGYKIPQYRSVDIDYKEDWDFAKKLFKIK